MAGAAEHVSIEAKSPFEMRINLAKDLPETDVRTAVAIGANTATIPIPGR